MKVGNKKVQCCKDSEREVDTPVDTQLIGQETRSVGVGGEKASGGFCRWRN